MIEKNTEDVILIQNILNGNHQAEEIFFKKYQRIIKDYIRNNFPKQKLEDIDDYTSEILIKIFENLKLIDSEKGSVKTWVLVIARHFITDVWRKDSTSFTSAFNNSGISISNNDAQNLRFNGEPTAWVAGNNTSLSNDNLLLNSCSFTVCNNSEFENCNTVSYLSSQISPVDYSLLNMKYMQGYSHCEIGKEFNLTSSTVSNRINYIKTKLKKQNVDILE
jgi:RNA polymerase sigma factor (sigma-70 family)